MALPADTAAARQEKTDRRKDAEEEALLREVDDAVRQGDLEDFAKNYGKPLLALLVVVLVGFGGYLYWDSQQEAALEADSEALISALDQVEAGNLQTAFDQLEPLATEGNGAVGANAQLLRAGIAAQQGNAEQAAQIFAAVADNEGAPAELRDLARIRQVAVSFDTMEPSEVVSLLGPISVPENQYFGSAGELVAMAELERGNNEEAGRLFAQISNADGVPESIKSRTRQMAGLLGVDAISDVDALLEAEGAGPDGANAIPPAE